MFLVRIQAQPRVLVWVLLLALFLVWIRATHRVLSQMWSQVIDYSVNTRRKRYYYKVLFAFCVCVCVCVYMLIGWFYYIMLVFILFLLHFSLLYLLVAILFHSKIILVHELPHACSCWPVFMIMWHMTWLLCRSVQIIRVALNRPTDENIWSWFLSLTLPSACTSDLLIRDSTT